MKLADGRTFNVDRPIDGVKYNVYDCPGEASAAQRVERGKLIEGTPSRLAHPLLSMDVDEGVTPFMVTCPNHGLATTSRFYRVVPVPSLFPVRMVWRKPTERELSLERRDGGNHYSQGGLAREWTGAEPHPQPAWVTSGRHG